MWGGESPTRRYINSTLMLKANYLEIGAGKTCIRDEVDFCAPAAFAAEREAISQLSRKKCLILASIVRTCEPAGSVHMCYIIHSITHSLQI